MDPNYGFVLPSLYSPPAPQLAHQFHPALSPGTFPESVQFNFHWHPEQPHAPVYITDQMSAVPPPAGMVAPTNNNDYRCKWLSNATSCNQTFENFDDLIVHLRTHDVQGSASRKLTCRWQLREGWYCGKECRRDGIKRHIGTHVGFSVPCPDCDKSFSREDTMRTHWKKKHEKA